LRASSAKASIAESQAWRVGLKAIHNGFAFTGTDGEDAIKIIGLNTFKKTRHESNE
jgi:hypothetical protein